MKKGIVVIFTGVDCSGKTSIIDELKKLYMGHDKIRFRVGKNGSLSEKKKQICDVCYEAFAGNTVVICDRLPFPADLVNSIIYDHVNSPFAEIPSHMECIAGYLKRVNVIFIEITARADIIESRFNSRGDEFIRLFQLLTSIELQKSVHGWVSKLLTEPFIWHTFDTSETSASEVAKQISNILNP